MSNDDAGNAASGLLRRVSRSGGHSQRMGSLGCVQGTLRIGVNLPVPAVIAGAEEQAKERYFEFFAAQIRNRNTRAAYLQAAHQFFGWLEAVGLSLQDIRPLHVAAYIEARQRNLSAPSIKQHLAGLRMLFNWFVLGQVLPSNPALFVKGPRFSRQTGIAPVLEAAQMRALLSSIETSTIKGLRDRAAIALMAYTFARVSAIALLRREDWSGRSIQNCLASFTSGRVSDRIYTRSSGNRVLLIENKVVPPESVDEVLWLRSDQVNQWLKPVPISRFAGIPNLPALATIVCNSWKDQFFFVEEASSGNDLKPGLRPPQIGALYNILGHWNVTIEPALVRCI